MALTRRSVFSAFMRPEPVSALIPDPNITKIRADYGDFCARINVHAPDVWRDRGIRDFPALCAVPGIVEIGVNLESSRLHLLSEPICVLDRRGALRTIGELIITYYAVTKTLTIQSVEGAKTREDTKVCAHPHVLDGTLCFSAYSEMMYQLLDARISAAMHVLMPCLRMDSNVLVLEQAYLPLEEWPLLKED